MVGSARSTLLLSEIVLAYAGARPGPPFLPLGLQSGENLRPTQVAYDQITVLRMSEHPDLAHALVKMLIVQNDTRRLNRGTGVAYCPECAPEESSVRYLTPPAPRPPRLVLLMGMSTRIKG